MADPLYELLAPYFKDNPTQSPPQPNDPTTAKYLGRLSTLQLGSLEITEPLSLAQASHSALLSLQSLSTRSSKAVIASADHLTSLRIALPAIAKDAGELRDAISTLDRQAISFSEKYSRNGENEVLDRRKKALLMSRNVDRLTDIMDLPTLLSSTVSSSSAHSATSTTSYATALDLHSHMKRLQILYQDSELVKSVGAQAEEVMQEMTSNLILSLRAQSVKLAVGMRTVGWLRRIMPELGEGSRQNGTKSGEGSLGALFLVCRLANLVSMLEALNPLKELADQESERRQANRGHVGNGNAWSGGQQTERYLKRYVEIFREQSFAIISMFKSIFPAADAGNDDDLGLQFKSLGLKSAPLERVKAEEDPLQPLPSSLSAFTIHLADLLTDTLKQYLPNVRDKSSRESLLTQVLYCAGSLGRLGGDFGMVLAFLDDDESDDDEKEEWVGIMKKHRMLAGRLELLASGVGTQGKGV
ncbi:MAG: hypothetical protein Q9187_002842 [Circinaria calcarea]